jgi:hypothetical protein
MRGLHSDGKNEVHVLYRVYREAPTGLVVNVSWVSLSGNNQTHPSPKLNIYGDKDKRCLNCVAPSEREVLPNVNVLWDVAPCGLVYRRFRSTFRLHRQNALMMEA